MSCAVLDILEISDIRTMPERVMGIVTGDLPVRNALYRRCIESYGGDLSYDWFQEVYEAELAEKKRKGQCFSPRELGEVVARIVGGGLGSVHEPTAGNGLLVISQWWYKLRLVLPWEFFPSENMVVCWECSDRSLPLLLFNLSIRGIMGEVYFGDVLENRVMRKYILLNRTDDALGFSEVIEDKDRNMHITRRTEYDI